MKNMKDKEWNYLKSQKDAERSRRRRKFYKENHCCISCGIQLEDDDTHVTCQKCRERVRQRRVKLKEQGMCTTCCMPLSDEDKASGYCTCAKCRGIQKQKSKEMYKKRKVDKAAKKLARGEDITKCSVCKGTIDEPGYLCCSKCRANAREKAARKKKQKPKIENY